MTTEPSAEKMIAQAREAEDAARAVKGVTNSEGAKSPAPAAPKSHIASQQRL